MGYLLDLARRAVTAEPPANPAGAGSAVRRLTSGRSPLCDDPFIQESADPRRAERLRRVRTLLSEDPGRRYALIADPDDPGRPGEVVLAIGVRANGDAAYAELRVPAGRYDALRLLELLHQHCGTVH